MKINEIVLSQLDEGPHDPHIFKAIFLSGGPGSGKSYVARQILQGYGLKFVNSDDIYEYLANKNDLDMSDPSQIISKQGQEIRGKAKDITNNKKGSHLRGRLGMVIDGTGKNLITVSKQVIGLRAIGYDCMMYNMIDCTFLIYLSTHLIIRNCYGNILFIYICRFRFKNI